MGGSAWVSSSFLVAIALMSFGCSSSTHPPVVPPTSSQVAEFLKHANLTLPESARPIGYRARSGGMDQALWISFSLPMIDVPAFLSTSPFQDGKLESKDEYILYLFDHFWQTPPTRYRSAQRGLPHNEAINLLIDESDATTAMIYMMWHET